MKRPEIVRRVIKTAPAYVVKKTDSGPMLILSAETLLNRTSDELKEAGFEVPKRVPPFAVVLRDPDGLLVFSWEESAE